MKKLFSFFFILFSELTPYGNHPAPMAGFSVNPLDPTTDILSGMTWTSNGLAVCDRGAGALLLIHDNHSTEILLDQLNTPVDVMDYGQEWLILQEIHGSLIGVHKETKQRRTIADGFLHPTAFTIDDQNKVYITEFDTGFLIRADLETGEKERLPIVFDRPADVLFIKPDRLIVADQVGMDLKGGSIYMMDRMGKILSVDNGIIDPTGLAVSPKGEIYASTFSIPNPYTDNRAPSLNGGVMRLQNHHPPAKIVSGLLGPTSILFDEDERLIVLEEPTDSLYRYSSSGERTPMLEGFAPVKQAARNNQEDIYVIENTPLKQIKIREQEGLISSWNPSGLLGMWDKIQMAVDGEGNVFLYDPLLFRIQVYNHKGDAIHIFSDLNPLYMAGIPSNGILTFMQEGESLTVSRLKMDENIEMFSFDWDDTITSAFAKSEDQLVLCMANGEIQELFLNSHEKKTILSADDGATYISSVLDKNNEEGFWLLDSYHRILYWDGMRLNIAAQAAESGLLLPDSNGVLFLEHSGKRFLIQSETAMIPDWNLY